MSGDLFFVLLVVFATSIMLAWHSFRWLRAPDPHGCGGGCDCQLKKELSKKTGRDNSSRK